MILPLLESTNSPQQIDQRVLTEILKACAEKTKLKVFELLGKHEPEVQETIAHIQKELESIMEKVKARALREVGGKDEDSKID